MKRFAKIIGFVLLSVILALILVVGFFGGPLIKQTINTAGPALLGVPVKLEAATFAPFKGQLLLKGLHVGNPEGFKTAGLFDLGSLDIDLDTATLFKKIMVIREIQISAPEITYERALKNSNIGQLLEQLGSKEQASAATQTKAASTPKAKGSKKVVIQKLSISGARVNASITALGGHAMVLPLPPISLSNIGGDGKEAQGVTFVEAIRDILSAVFKGVTEAVTGAGKLAVDGAKAVGGAATEGVKAVGGAVADGAKAIGSGAGKALGGVKNLIGLGSKEEQPAKSEK